MSGPTLAMAAPAVEASLPFQRSTSMPDLAAGMPTMAGHHKAGAAAATSAAAASAASAAAAGSKKPPHSQHSSRPLPSSSDSRPSSPKLAFDMPAFGLETRLDISFQFEKDSAPGPITASPISSDESADRTRPGKLSWTRSVMDRPRSWLPGSLAGADARQSVLLDGHRKLPGSVDSNLDKAGQGAVAGLEDGGKGRRRLERTKTTEFTDLARRSWMSSPKPPSAPKTAKADKTIKEQDERQVRGEANGAAPGRTRSTSLSRALGNKLVPRGVWSSPVPALPADAASRLSSESLSRLSPSRASGRGIFFNKTKQNSPYASSPAASTTALAPSPPALSLSPSPLAATSASALRPETSSSSKPPPQKITPATAVPGITAPTPALSGTTIAPSSGTTIAPASIPAEASNLTRLSVTTDSSSTTEHSSAAHSNLSSSDRNKSYPSSLDTATTRTVSEDASQVTGDTSLSMPPGVSHDPLWNAFRMLDADHVKLVAKPATNARMAAMRSTLVPFLRSTSHHPSNTNREVLAPEDIDRRATILNKWWVSMLEMLEGGQAKAGLSSTGAGLGLAARSGSGAAGHNAQPVTGVDRSTLLEATAMVMVRPEWTMCTITSQPQRLRSFPDSACLRPWMQTAEGSDGSDAESAAGGSAFVAASAEHNVRNMFVANLYAQMGLVVDKMAMRQPPPSLVSWCAKACAYAFFFAPGIADVLVRLWSLEDELLRRIAAELDLTARTRRDDGDAVAAHFPPHLGSLGWTSTRSMAARLRKPATLPFLPAKIPWNGEWVSRWMGIETDLLFVFFKQYHILAAELMPAGLSLADKARSPAFVLVHAQLLALLDGTIHRRTTLAALLSMPLLSDAAHGADATLTALPIASNLERGMEENRLVILLKDMLAPTPANMVVALSAKKAFAEAFAIVMKAAAKRTSRFEHAGGLILCDFLEEALRTMDGFWTRTSLSETDRGQDWDGVRDRVRDRLRNQSDDGLTMASKTAPKQTTGLDWPFWLGVCRMMLESNNNMSEMRVVSLIFSMWDVLTATPERKETLCVGWLLSEEVFSRFFCHWCPIVRAYYMRLLCWRICRDEGSSDELDARIFTLVSHRLKTLWSHYLWQKQTADAQGRLAPSTAPCHPAPGRRFVIVKTLVPAPQPGLLVGGCFDAFSGSGMPDVFAGIHLNADGSVLSGTAVPQEPVSASPTTSYRKKWGFLGKVLSFTSSPASGSGASKTASGPGGSSKRTWQDELEQARRDTAAAASKAAAAARNEQQQYFPVGSQPTANPPTPPSKQSGKAKTPSSPGADSCSSTGSSPLYDATANNYIFRFTLGPQNQMALVGGPPPNRVLSRPRLPAPAQARVTALTAAVQRSVVLKGGGGGGGLVANGGEQARSDSPSPVAPDLPLETRASSGAAQTRLISEARNSRPLDLDTEAAAEPTPSLASATLDTPTAFAGFEQQLPLKLSEPLFRPFGDELNGAEENQGGGEDATAVQTGGIDSAIIKSNEPQASTATTQAVADGLDESQPLSALVTVGIVEPTPPAGFAVACAVYIGRALAEWAVVTTECNSFIDRRRNEGVPGLSEVEVPLLSVEGTVMRSRG